MRETAEIYVVRFERVCDFVHDANGGGGRRERGDVIVQINEIEGWVTCSHFYPVRHLLFKLSYSILTLFIRASLHQIPVALRDTPTNSAQNTYIRGGDAFTRLM